MKVKYIMIFFIQFIYLLLSFSNAEKFCVNCKHFKPTLLLSNNEFSKCSVFPREIDNKIDYLVSGKPKIEYKYCKTVRQNEDMCGPKGKYYEKKTHFFRKITCNKDKND